MSDPASIRRAGDVLGSLAQRDAPLGPLTTYRVGGRAALLVTAGSEDDLRRVADAAASGDIPVLVIGKGSNLLVADDGFAGIAVRLGEGFDDVSVDGTTVRAGGAASLPVVARQTVRAGLTGFEWAVGVPGSIGGAVRMNAGGHGSDIAAALGRVRVLDVVGGEDCIVPADRLDLAYRSSNLAATQIVVWAELRLGPGDRARGEAEVSEIVRWRRANQPGGQNAGSVFTNPPGDSAGRLIDAAGCKGLRIGTAEVSPKHANFIQADEGGSADDVFALMGEVRRRVHADSGISLHHETVLVGFPTAVGEPA
jgi:UDP-N-acetylmuramate dehydrogenase